MEQTTKPFELGPIQKEWVETLEKHPERQMKDALGYMETNGDFKCCCLGQGGLISGVCEWDENCLTTIETRSQEYLNGMNVYGSLGLRDYKGSPIENDKSLYSLAVLNDDKQKTWPEIAAIIRKNAQYYFTKSV